MGELWYILYRQKRGYEHRQVQGAVPNPIGVGAVKNSCLFLVTWTRAEVFAVLIGNFGIMNVIVVLSLLKVKGT